MDNLGAHGRGGQRNIWIVTAEGLEEVTPIEGTERAARELCLTYGERFYLRRSAQGDGFGWAAYDATRPVTAPTGKWFPTRDAAVMYAVMKGGR